ncbi:DUF2163 domain-containing protein [Altererythrobacter sp. MF3-039]|uniref:DUF2163 domain-containing protein n=1 Tax=Altererythrobacter sp. MF3-039 TaxID=3252901 RepID=UPI00390CD71B
MSRVFFATELEGVATFWRIYRRDGVTLGFTSHDRDLYFDGTVHRAAPGMLPSSIRKTAGFSGDSAEMQGALTHASLSPDDLAAGRFDSALVEVGAVDWETLEREILFGGSIGAVEEEGTRFSAELASAKAIFGIDPIARTSPTCRADFCGPGCTLPAAMVTQEAAIIGSDPANKKVDFGLPNFADFQFGEIRWLGGPLAGRISRIMAADPAGLVIEQDFSGQIPTGTRALIRQGCDHLLSTCNSRFSNAINFQGEPYLPGNDLLAQYPNPQ